MHVITHYSWLSLPFLCLRLRASHSALLLLMSFFLSERHCGLEGNLHHHPIIPCLQIVPEWMAAECFDVWNTFPGGKIVAKEEYRMKGKWGSGIQMEGGTEGGAL